MASANVHPPSQEDLKLLAEVSQLLTSLDLETVMRQVINLMSRAVGAARASLFLHHENQIDWDHIFLMRNLNRDETIVALRTVLDEGLAGWVMRHKEATIVYDTESDPRWHVFPEDTHQTRSVLCVPLIHNDAVLAVLTLVHPEPAHFDEHHLELARIIANQAVLAIRNAQLFNQTIAQQHQLEAILRALPEILFVLDHQGKILRINDGVLDLLGGGQTLQRQDIIGHTLSEFTSEHQPGHLLTVAQRLIDQPPPGGDSWAFEVRDEERGRDYQVTMGTWENPAQQVQGYTLLMHDITTLRDLHRFKDDMLKIVSHDLRNPVSLIISAHEMLKLDLPPIEPESNVPRYLEIIEQATGRMENLLDDLVRAEPSNQQRIDPAQVIQAVVERIRPMATNKRQTLEVEFVSDEAMLLVADPMLLGEAMENYLSNAVKYTPRKGRILVKAYIQDDRFQFVVEDNGIGIAEEHLPHLFDPYYRPPGTVEQGYGIGLNLVKTIIERHQGRVWVESIVNVGSRFGFWLPLPP